MFGSVHSGCSVVRSKLGRSGRYHRSLATGDILHRPDRTLSMTKSHLEQAASAAYQSALRVVASVCPEVADQIVAELAAQKGNLKLIASENFCSPAVQLALGNWLTDKYAEGVPNRRFYAGCEHIDQIESLAARLACELFGADHAYVQPHSGADANLVAFLAILMKRVEMPALAAADLLAANGALDAIKLQRAPLDAWESVRAVFSQQRLLALDFSSGGHLTHGYRLNISAKLFETHTYKVEPDSGLIDYDKLDVQAQRVRPLILLAGFSAYPRKLDFARLREIADHSGATLVVDMAHFAGLVAGKVFTGVFNPVPYADIVTSTTHKTLRGPRGGLILCRSDYAEYVDRGCPLVLGGPLPHVIAAKAVCFSEALRPEFQQYAAQIVSNSQALARAIAGPTVKVLSGGTDNHLVLLDVSPSGLTGRQAEDALRSCGITLNRNAIPGDTRSPLVTSGLRLGTAALTTLGMREPEMEQVAQAIGDVLSNARPSKISSGDRAGQESVTGFVLSADVTTRVKRTVLELLDRFPLYPFLDVAVLSAAAGVGSA